MTKKELQMAVNLFKKVSNQFGIKDKLVRQDGKYIYIDGDIYDAYWNTEQWFSGFNAELNKQLSKRGYWLEPETYSVLSLVKE